MSTFAEIRDAFAIQSMLKRKEDYETKAAGALAEAKALRTKLRYTPKGSARDHLQESYDIAMREWAYFETCVGDIERDARYIAHMAKQAEG